MFKQAKPFWVATAILLMHSSSWAQAHGTNAKDMKFATMPTLPSCATAATPQGDPAKGPSFIVARAGKGCVVPWHWHTANETVIMVSGEARIDMKDASPVTLTAGGIARMPSKQVHRFTCLKACTLYVYSDAIFDIHYVDPAGKEINMDEALKQKP